MDNESWRSDFQSRKRSQRKRRSPDRHYKRALLKQSSIKTTSMASQPYVVNQANQLHAVVDQNSTPTISTNGHPTNTISSKPSTTTNSFVKQLQPSPQMVTNSNIKMVNNNQSMQHNQINHKPVDHRNGGGLIHRNGHPPLSSNTTSSSASSLSSSARSTSSSSSNSTTPNNNFVSAQHDFVQQTLQARSSSQFGGYKMDDYDPDSNVYVANLPSTFGKEKLYNLFAPYGQIVRYKFVTPDEPTQPGYGFVQFGHRKGAHKAIKALEGHTFQTGEVIYLSIALRRRSSLSDEPTNLYVKNLPSHWSNDKLRKVFSAYGQIRQSKVVGDGIAFVRFEDHEQALDAIQKMDKQIIEPGFKLEVRFATRKTAANAYRLQQVPQSSKSNENNLYIRNLPKFYTQQNLEQLFISFGKISSAKINDNGIAFVRFAHGEDAQRAIKELNGQKPPNFEEEIVVKLAHFDIGDSRNRWNNKFQGNLNGSAHFNSNVYQNHFNAPTMGHGASVGGGYNPHPHSHHHSYGSFGPTNSTPLSSVPSIAPSVASNSSFGSSNDMPSQGIHNTNNMRNREMNSMTNMIGQWSLGNNGGVSAANPPNINNQLNQANNGHQQATNLSNPNDMLQQQQQQQQQHTTAARVLSPQSLINPLSANQFGFPQLMQQVQPTQFNIQQQQQMTANTLNTLPQQSISPTSEIKRSANAIFTKKQQALGDILYQKVFAKCGADSHYAPKITGMLLKMGDLKAQQYIDNPHILEEQIKIAKKLLQNQFSSTPAPPPQDSIPRLTSIGNNIFPPLSGLYSPAIPPTMSIPNLLSGGGAHSPFLYAPPPAPNTFSSSIPQVTVVSPTASIPQQQQPWEQSQQPILKYEIDTNKPIIRLNASALSWGNAVKNSTTPFSGISSENLIKDVSKDVKEKQENK